MSITIHLLGPFRILVDGVPVDERRWVRRKSKVLVKLLALQPRRQLHKEELINLLWPDLDLEQGLNNLHKALHAARHALEPELSAGSPSRFLQMREQLVVLQSTGDLWIDVTAFETQAREALQGRVREELEAALAIYESDLLPEDLYEDWAAGRREQLRLLREQLLARLAAVCEGTGDTARALELYQQLIAANRCNEDAHRAVMRLHATAGRRHLAIEQFRICTEALRAELAAEPEQATLDLYEQILAGTVGQKPEPEPANVSPANYLDGRLCTACFGSDSRDQASLAASVWVGWGCNPGGPARTGNRHAPGRASASSVHCRDAACRRQRCAGS